MLGGGCALLGGLAAPYVTMGASARGRQLCDVPELPVRREGNIVTAELHAAPTTIELADGEVELLCYNGCFPGPSLKLAQDDELTVSFSNGLGQPTNLHTHGMAVSPVGDGDNPFIRVGPGERRDYRFDLRGDPRNCGLFWYHPHFHGTDARQLAAGLAGPIVVEGEADPGPALGVHDARVLVLKDLRLGAEGLRLHRPGDWLMGLEGERLLVNGLEEPVLEARERRLRLRIVNASNARYWDLSLPGADGLWVVALDGHATQKPVPVRDVALAPGQRVDLVVDLPRDGPVDVIDLPVPRVIGKGRRARRVMVIEPPGGARAPLDALPERLAERLAERADPAPPVTTRDVVFSLFYICGQSYAGPAAQPLFRPRLGSRETWRIWNADTMDHPFHLHTWPFRVETLDGRPVEGRPLRDTLNLGPGGRAEISVDFTGVWGLSMFHCHIAEHAAKGMMATLEVEA